MAAANDLLQQKFIVPMVVFGALNPDFVFLYGLSDTESNRLKDTIAATKQKVAEVEASHATIEKTGEDHFTILIPILPKAGGVVYDEFIGRIRNLIGEKRWDFYESLNGNEFERSPEFSMFGLQTTSIEVRPLNNENGGPQAFMSSSVDSDGGVHQTGRSDPRILKMTHPLLYQKMLDGGFITPLP